MKVKIFFYFSLLLFVLTAGYWIVQHPYFRIAHIDIRAQDDGSLKHAQVEQIFTAVRPELTGSFFTINLQAAQKAALAQPWVKEVKIDRIAPATVKLEITEYDAAARWMREGEQAGLIAPDGMVFQAASNDKLPELDGEFGDLLPMLEQHKVFESRLKPLRLDIKRLQYKPHGAWSLMLNNGIEVRLGKENVHARLMRFADLWPRQLAAQAAYIDYLDMRYPHGAAMKRREDAPPVSAQEEVETE
ncbi:cell division protein FtsQ/DivIB [Neisseriaceae bacterium B1]